MDRERIVVAEIMREWGNRGELLARSLTDVPGRLESLTTARVQMSDGHDEEVQIESARAHKADWLIKLAEVDSIDSAQRYRGADLWVPKDRRASLSEGEYFRSDLIGAKVLDRKTGQVIGTVEGFEDYGGPPLLRIGGPVGEKLIPFVPEICVSVDLPEFIHVDLPEGLLDL